MFERFHTKKCMPRVCHVCDARLTYPKNHQHYALDAPLSFLQCRKLCFNTTEFRFIDNITLVRVGERERVKEEAVVCGL